MSAKSAKTDSGQAHPLIEALRALHLRAGRPSARAMAAAIGNVSHTTVAEALNGKRVPSWPIMQSIVGHLGGDEAAIHALWVEAVEPSPAEDVDNSTGDHFLAHYRRQVMAHHSQLVVPGSRELRTLGIDALFVPPTVTLRESVEMREVDLDAIFDEANHVVLLGAPGSGKSSICSWLMRERASTAADSVPFHVSLREFSGESAPLRSVVSFIEFQLETVLQCPAPSGYISQCMHEGSAVVIFDGLDEVAETLIRATVVSAIESFCNEFPSIQVLVTSRTAGYQKAQLDPRIFVTCHIENFGDTQVEQYVHQWFSWMRPSDTADEIRALTNAFLQQTANQTDMRATPLLLAMMCAMHQETGLTARSLPELYDNSARLMLERNLQNRRFEDSRARHLVTPLLRRIAFWLLSEKGAQLVATETQLASQTAAYLSSRLDDRDDIDALTRQLVKFFCERSSILQEVGTSAQGERLFSFTQLTLVEYFAANHLVANANNPEQLAEELVRRTGQEPWESVSKLALLIVDRQIERGGERVVRVWLEKINSTHPDKQRAWYEILFHSPDLVYLPPSITQAIARLKGHQKLPTTESDQVGESDVVGYRGPAACQIAGITYRQLDYWSRMGLAPPSIKASHGSESTRLYSFKDLLILKVVKRLLDTGVSLQNIRVATDHLHRRSVRDLAAITLFSDGDIVYECTSPEEIADLLQGGQGVFGIAVSGAMQEIDSKAAEFPSERADGTVTSPRKSEPRHEQPHWRSPSRAG